MAVLKHFQQISTDKDLCRKSDQFTTTHVTHVSILFWYCSDSCWSVASVNACYTQFVFTVSWLPWLSTVWTILSSWPRRGHNIPRITETDSIWSWTAPLNITKSPPPPKQGHLEWGDQSHVQLSFEYLHDRRPTASPNNLFECSINLTVGKKYVLTVFLLFQFVPNFLVISLGTIEKSLSPSSLSSIYEH